MNPRRDSKGLERLERDPPRATKDTEVFHKRALDNRTNQLLVHQLLVLIILSILCIHVQYVENRFNGTWPLLLIGIRTRCFTLV